MGVLSNNYAQIVPGALISASYVSDIYDVLLGSATESIRLHGSLTVTGSVVSTSGFNGSLIGNVTGNVVGNLTGTASFATSASKAITASYISATSLTITPTNPLPLNVLTGSFAVSSSVPPKPYFWDGTTWNALY